MVDQTAFLMADQLVLAVLQVDQTAVLMDGQ
jgi:hypothetical protein